MAGDTWFKTRSERILRQRQTHTHTHTQHTYTHSQWPSSNCRTLDTNTHSCQGQTKIIHKTPSPPPLGVTDTVSPSYAHTHGRSCREAACCPCGLWRIITQQCRLKSREWTSFLNAQASSSPRHQPPQKGVPTVAGSCSACFLRNVNCAVWTGTIQRVWSPLSQNCISLSSDCVQVNTPRTFQWRNTCASKMV